MKNGNSECHWLRWVCHFNCQQISCDSEIKNMIDISFQPCPRTFVCRTPPTAIWPYLSYGLPHQRQHFGIDCRLLVLQIRQGKGASASWQAATQFLDLLLAWVHSLTSITTPIFHQKILHLEGKIIIFVSYLQKAKPTTRAPHLPNTRHLEVGRSTGSALRCTAMAAMAMSQYSKPCNIGSFWPKLISLCEFETVYTIAMSCSKQLVGRCIWQIASAEEKETTNSVRFAPFSRNPCMLGFVKHDDTIQFPIYRSIDLSILSDPILSI